MNDWRSVWRHGIAPCLGEAGLECLRDALISRDPALVRGITALGRIYGEQSVPVSEQPICAACPVALAGWRGLGLANVREAQEFFSDVSFKVEQLTGETGAMKHFANWWDEGPLDRCSSMLLHEVEAELARRRAAA